MTSVKFRQLLILARIFRGLVMTLKACYVGLFEGPEESERGVRGIKSKKKKKIKNKTKK